MLRAKGDIWKWLDTGHLIVVPTNLGYRSDGDAIMGRGVAKDAARRFPGLERWYGQILRACRELTPVVRVEDMPLILFPTKKHDRRTPHLSWKGPADIKLIQLSIWQLASMDFGGQPVALPMVGCGHGELDPLDVLMPLEHRLDDRFTLVER